MKKNGNIPTNTMTRINLLFQTVHALLINGHKMSFSLHCNKSLWRGFLQFFKIFFIWIKEQATNDQSDRQEWYTELICMMCFIKDIADLAFFLPLLMMATATARQQYWNFNLAEEFECVVNKVVFTVFLCINKRYWILGLWAG